MPSTNGDAGNSGKDRNDAMREIAAGIKSIARAINPAIFRETMVIQVSNQTTELKLGILVKVCDESSIYDGIYNNNEVKKALLRRFPNPERTQLQNGDLEIHCYLKNDDSEILFDYTVDCMETQTIKQLFDIASLHTKEPFHFEIRACEVPSSELLEELEESIDF
jgi:hypothetical protein